MIRTFIITAMMPLLACGLPASAQDAEDTSGPISTIVPTSDNEQALRQSLVVEAPIDVVWALFTSDEGITNWMAPAGHVELRNGGMIRTNYDACAGPEDEGWIENTIVNYVPSRFLTLQADLEPQREASWMNEAIYARRDNLYSVIEIEEVAPERTRITMWGLGYGTGPEWQVILDFFTVGNEWTFGQLQRAIAGEDVYPACDRSAD